MHNVLIISYIAFSIGNLFILPESLSESWNHILKICIPRNIRILPGETSGPKGGGSDDPTPADRAWREKMIHLR